MLGAVTSCQKTMNYAKAQELLTHDPILSLSKGIAAPLSTETGKVMFAS